MFRYSTLVTPQNTGERGIMAYGWGDDHDDQITYT